MGLHRDEKSHRWLLTWDQSQSQNVINTFKPSLSGNGTVTRENLNLCREAIAALLHR